MADEKNIIEELKRIRETMHNLRKRREKIEEHHINVAPSIQPHIPSVEPPHGPSIEPPHGPSIEPPPPPPAINGINRIKVVEEETTRFDYEDNRLKRRGEQKNLGPTKILREGRPIEGARIKIYKFPVDYRNVSPHAIDELQHVRLNWDRLFFWIRTNIPGFFARQEPTNHARMFDRYEIMPGSKPLVTGADGFYEMPKGHLEDGKIYIVYVETGTYRYQLKAIRYDSKQKDPKMYALFLMGRGILPGRIPESGLRRTIAGAESDTMRFGAKTPAWGKATYETGTLRQKEVAQGMKATLPAIRKAINSGRSTLGKKARDEYRRLVVFERKRLKIEQDELKKLQKDLEDAEKALGSSIGKLKTAASVGHPSPADLDDIFKTNKKGKFDVARIMKVADSIAGNRGHTGGGGDLIAQNDIVEHNQKEVERIEAELTKKKDEFEKAETGVGADKKGNAGGASDVIEEKIRAFLASQVGKEVDRLVYAYRLTKIVGAKDEITTALNAEVTYLAEFWGRHHRMWLTRMFGRFGIGMRRVSHGMQGLGDIWHMATSNILGFISSPLIFGAAIIFLQMTIFSVWFYDWPQYINYFSASHPLILAIIGAVAVFVVNYATTNRGIMDWIGHLVGGATMALLIFMLLLALDIQAVVAILTFWIIYAIMLFIGIFQFYPSGGFRFMAIAAVIVIVFSYFAVGPYSQQIKSVKDQMMTP
ncbi:MAG: Yip1 family protein, partial [Candidatus Aenigmatarchaeota archaeon]